MGIKDKVNKELEMRRRYKKHYEEHGTIIFKDYESFKKQTLKNDAILENNIHVISQLESLVEKVILDHPDVAEELEGFREFIKNNSEKTSITYSVLKRESEGKTTYYFDAVTTVGQRNKMRANIVTGSLGEIISLEETHLDFTHPGYRGLGEKGLSPSNRLIIKDLDTNNPTIIRQRSESDCFTMKEVHGNDYPIEWEDVTGKKVAKRR